MALWLESSWSQKRCLENFISNRGEVRCLGDWNRCGVTTFPACLITFHVFTFSGTILHLNPWISTFYSSSYFIILIASRTSIQTLSRSQANKNIETIILWYFKSCVFIVLHRTYLYVFHACYDSTMCNETLEEILPCSGHFALETEGSVFFKQIKQFKKQLLPCHFLIVSGTNCIKNTISKRSFFSSWWVRDLFEPFCARRMRRVVIRCSKTRRRCVIISTAT